MNITMITHIIMKNIKLVIRLKYKFILFSPKINDEVEMYVNKKNPNITVSPWNTFLYKFYFNLIIICILIPFIIYILK